MDYSDINYEKIPELSRSMESFFSHGRSIGTTAMMDWRFFPIRENGDSFWKMAESYFDGADYLLGVCLNDNLDHKADLLVFPILFDIVHGIELGLKAINDYLCFFLTEDNQYRTTHNLKNLIKYTLDLLKRFIKEQGNSPEFKEIQTSLKLVESFIFNVYEKTDDMAFARYPISSKKEMMFYAESDSSVSVDLELLLEQLHYVFAMLDYVMNQMFAYMDWWREAYSY